MNGTRLAALGLAVRRAWVQQSPSEWPLGLRRAFRALLATAVCAAVLLLADVAGDAQAWRAQAQQREALQAQRTQYLDDLARWGRTPSPGLDAPMPTPQALLHTWTEAATAAGWTVESSQVMAQADGRTALHLHLQGRFADWPQWWSRTSARAPGVTLRAWQIEALSPQRVRVEVVADMAELHDEGRWPLSASADAAAPRAEPDPFNVQTWVEQQWQQAQTDARVAQWLPRWRQAPAVLTQAHDRDLRYRGRIQSQRRDVALVQIAASDAAAPGPVKAVPANVHAVAVGDALGPDLGQVVQIDDERLVLQRWRRDAAGVWQAHARVLLRDDPASTRAGARP